VVRILQLHNRYRETGGEDLVARTEAALLRSGGHEVIEHHVDNPAGALRSAQALAASSWNPSSARLARGLAARHRPDIAHVHNTWFTLSASVLPALRAAGVPVVVTLHNYRVVCANALLLRDGRPCEDCVGTHPWRAVRHRCYRGSAVASAFAAAAIATHRSRHTWEHVDRFIVPSEFVRDRAIAGGLPAERIVTKPHGTDDPGPRRASPSASSTVLCVGRVADYKGTDVLLDAWERTSPNPYELVVVGDGPLRARLEARAVKGVRFAGWQPPAEVRRLMLSARALVLPSICYETFSCVVLEAMAAGLAVVASARGGAAEVVAGLGEDCLVPPGDAMAWSAALGGLQDDQAVDAAGRRARALYEARYTARRSLTGLLDVYAAAAAHRRCGRPAGEVTAAVTR
jgi:glycosyltransferase involved in cell wall biosynthesis